MYKMVILVRSDIHISAGKLAVQVAHASVSCVIKTKRIKPRWFREWFAEGQKKIVLKVNNEKEIMNYSKIAQEHGLVEEIVRDAGLTEIPPGTVTALAIGPAPAEMIDKITGKLPTL